MFNYMRELRTQVRQRFRAEIQDVEDIYSGQHILLFENVLALEYDTDKALASIIYYDKIRSVYEVENVGYLGFYNGNAMFPILAIDVRKSGPYGTTVMVYQFAALNNITTPIKIKKVLSMPGAYAYRHGPVGMQELIIMGPTYAPGEEYPQRKRI